MVSPKQGTPLKNDSEQRHRDRDKLSSIQFKAENKCEIICTIIIEIK